MLPVLRRCGEKTWIMRDLVSRIADDLNLTSEERSQQIPSGGTSVIASRVHWAKTYLKQAGLLEQPKRGVVQISERGREVLSRKPGRIDPALLQQFAEFRAFLGRAKVVGEGGAEPITPTLGPTVPAPSSTPEEQIAAASVAIDEALRDALLARILEASPAFFEKLIIDLLLAMGYGGSRLDAGEQLGGTGDGGVDGVIREDQLGLDQIYLQAKRYRPGNTVPGETVQAFIGALIGKGAQKGVFITTSTFTKSAMGAANRSGSVRVVLIDGGALTKLMVRFNVGTRIALSVDIKKIDLDYFEDVEVE
ncbi:restriction endonuclease [Lichenicoccus sp.]|uniref:restriction endonuclease n=1 Tax=Lichenicoccus sp. TaxID=2781899 RepID=UPI003D1381D2